MSNTKNPFEIRFDTLAMAKEMLDKSYETQINVFYQGLDKAREANKDMIEYTDKYLPKMYSPTEVMKQAQELYSFVTKKD
jgi:hypothetical protein